MCIYSSHCALLYFVLAGTGLPRTAPPRDRRAAYLEVHFIGFVNIGFVINEKYDGDGVRKGRIVLPSIRFRP